MACQVVKFGDGFAFVCGPRQRRRKCACGSGRDAVFLCDWKTPGETKTGTCDASICSACSRSPTKGKDLCPTHWKAYLAWKERRNDQTIRTQEG